MQKAWIYLENIFVGSEDIRPHLPQESIMFDMVSDGFTLILRKMFADPLAVNCCVDASTVATLEDYGNKLEKIQKSLDDYLEKKRQVGEFLGDGEVTIWRRSGRWGSFWGSIWGIRLHSRVSRFNLTDGGVGSRTKTAFNVTRRTHDRSYIIVPNTTFSFVQSC